MRCVVQYDGAEFLGFQRLPAGPTVQGALEEAFSQVCGECVRVVGAGRTDAGVHATGQVVHLDLGAPIPLANLEQAVNRRCARSLRVLKLEEISSEFHARFSAVDRTYHYWFSRVAPGPFLADYVSPVSSLRSDAGTRMRQALDGILGRHNFVHLSAGVEGGTTIRTLKQVSVREEGDLIRVELTADAFLRSMVRVIAGWLTEIAQGRREPEDLARALRGEFGLGAVRTAAPEGLYLVRVRYPDGYPGDIPGFVPIIVRGGTGASEQVLDSNVLDCSLGELR